MLMHPLSFGYIVAASFMCAEKYLISRLFPQSNILRHSFFIKSAFIVVELTLVILFLVLLYHKVYAPSVVLEWVVGLIFALYMWSCAIDFFAIPLAGEKSGAMVMFGRDWDEEVAIASPKKIRAKIVHRDYIELP